MGALRQRPECGEEVAGVGKEGPGPQPACIHLVPWGGGGGPLELRPRPDPHEPVRREGSCDGYRGREGLGSSVLHQGVTGKEDVIALKSLGSSAAPGTL